MFTNNFDGFNQPASGYCPQAGLLFATSQTRLSEYTHF
jgi:hypothetical protein